MVSGLAYAAPDNWAVKSAPWRVTLKAETPPDMPETGWEIRIPDFGDGRADMRDVVLLGLDDQEIAIDSVWRGRGKSILMLAKAMPTDGVATLYFGGNVSRRMRSWTAMRSLLLETRGLATGAKITTYADWQDAWNKSQVVDGADFVPLIFQGENPFGDNSRFLSRFTGFIKTEAQGELKFYTLSKDVSYVMVNGRSLLKWDKNQPPPLDPLKVPTGIAKVEKGVTKIEYCHGVVDAPAAMVLGWEHNGKLGNVPPEAWVHPGKVTVSGFQSVDGTPVPLANVEAESYTGYADQWYVKVKASIPDPGVGWQVEWLWSDGRVDHGPEVHRLWMSLETLQVIVRLRNAKRLIEGHRTLMVPKQLSEISVNNGGQLNGYLELLGKDDPAIMPEAARKAGFLLAKDFLPRSKAAKWAKAWLALAKPAGGQWVQAMVLAIREIAKTDPKTALAKLAGLSPEARTAMGKQADLLGLDIRVFGLQDPMVIGLVAKLEKSSDPVLAEMAKIRLGDYDLLKNRVEDATRCFESLKKGDPQKSPVIDRASSLAIEDLVNRGYIDDAEAKLETWERERPAAKIDSDQLYWRARVMFLAADWQRALQDLETSLTVRPGSPEEIDVKFWQGRALYELGRKDEARKIWNTLVKDYPKHERAEAAKLWMEKQ